MQWVGNLNMGVSKSQVLQRRVNWQDFCIMCDLKNPILTFLHKGSVGWYVFWVICSWNQFEEKAQWVFNLLFSCNLHSTFLPKCGHPNTHLWCLQCNVLNILEVNTVFFYVDVIRQSFFPARNRLIIGFKSRKTEGQILALCTDP